MKILFSLLFSFVLYPAFTQVTKYVARPPVGSDANPGTRAAPYATLTKARDNVAGVPGDSILLKNGDAWPEMVFITSGTKGNIYWGTWDRGGPNAVIQGYRDISALLVSEGTIPGLYKYQSSTLPQPVRALMIDSVLQGKGRWPLTGYRVFEDTSWTRYNAATPWKRDTITDASQKGLVTIIDNELSEEAPYDFTGAEVVVSKFNWTLDRQSVVKHSGDTIFSFTGNGESFPSYQPLPGYGYFFQNDKRLCTYYGAWAFDSTTKTIYVNLGLSGPGTKKIWVTDLVRSFNIAGDNNRFENLTFIGHNDYNVITGASNLKARFDNCEFWFAGYAGLYTSEQKGFKFYGCKWKQQPNNGLYMLRNTVGCDSTEVIGGEVSDVGTIPGMGRSTSGYIGLQVIGDSVKISGVKIRRTGYNGIHWEGAGCEIAYNDIDTVCFVRADGAGIYGYKGGKSGDFFEPASGVYSEIHHNTVANVLGIGTTAEVSGVAAGWDGHDDHGKGMAYYFDEKIYNVNFHDNVAFNIASTAFFYNNPRNIRSYNNKSFKSWRGGYALTYDLTAGGRMQGMQFYNNKILLTDTISTLHLNPSYGRKKFFELDTDINGGNLSSPFTLFEYNQYFTPVTTYKHFWGQNGSSAPIRDWTFTEWKTATGFDQNSSVRAIGPTVQFMYNPTGNTLSKPVSGSWVDEDGVPYKNQLAPYTAKFLFPSGAKKAFVRGVKLLTRGGKITTN